MIIFILKNVLANDEKRCPDYNKAIKKVAKKANITTLG